MKTIENSIKYLEGTKDGSVNQFDYCAKAADIIISQLKRGEKFEEMWEELFTNNINYPIYVDKVINNIKQKYFPKEE